MSGSVNLNLVEVHQEAKQKPKQQGQNHTSLNKSLQARGVTISNETDRSENTERVIKVLNQLANNEARAQSEHQGRLTPAKALIPTLTNKRQPPKMGLPGHSQTASATKPPPQAIAILQDVKIRILSEEAIKREYGKDYAKSEGLYDDDKNTIIINADRLTGDDNKLAQTLIEEALHAKQDKEAEQAAIKANKDPKTQTATHRDTEIEIAKQLQIYSKYYNDRGDTHLSTKLIVSKDPNKNDGIHTRIASDIRDKNDYLRKHYNFPNGENYTDQLNDSLKDANVTLQVQLGIPLNNIQEYIDDAISAINEHSADHDLQDVNIVLTNWINDSDPNDKSYFNENTRTLYIKAESYMGNFDNTVIRDALSKATPIPEIIEFTTNTETVNLTDQLDGGLQDLGVFLTGKQGYSEHNKQIVDALNHLYRNRDTHDNWPQIKRQLTDLSISLDGWRVSKRGEYSSPHSRYEGGREHRLQINYNYGINNPDATYGDAADLQQALLNIDAAPFTQRRADRIRKDVVNRLAEQESPFASKTEHEYANELVRRYPHNYEAAQNAVESQRQDDLQRLEQERQRVLGQDGNEPYRSEINEVFDKLKADMDTKAGSQLYGGYYQRTLASLELNWDESNRSRERTESETKIPERVDGGRGRTLRLEADGGLPYTYSTQNETKQYYANVDGEWKPIEKSENGYQLSEGNADLYSRSSATPWLMSTEKSQHLQLDPVNTESVEVEEDYINWYGASDNGYSRLREKKDELVRQLLDKYSGYSDDKKQDILAQLRSSGGINFHGILQDRHGEHNKYDYSFSIDPDLVEGEADTLENYIRKSVDQFYSTFRNYVENKEQEGKVLIDYLKLKATTPTINTREPLSNDLLDALGIVDKNGGRFDPASQAGKKKQNEVLNQILTEAKAHGGDLTQSPTFVNAAYKLAEKSPGFADMTEVQQQEAAAEAGKTISEWIKQQRIDEITTAQNQLKDSPITPDVLFLQELADAMGVSPKSLSALASKKNWDGKSAFEHLSSEASLYQFLNALVPDYEAWESGGNLAGSGGYRANSNRKGHSKQQIIDKLYEGLEVVDESKKANFLRHLDRAFGDTGSGRKPDKDDTVFLDYDSLPEFMRDFPAYFTKKREELATEARKKFNFLEAKKQAIKNDTEADFNEKYETFKQANPDSPPGSVPELDQLGLSQEQKSNIEKAGDKFKQQMIAATDKDDFKALSTNTQRTLASIAEIFETFVPIIGPLVAAPLHAAAGNWASFGTSLASGLTDVLSLGAGKIAGAIGRSVTKFAQAAGKTAKAAAEAGEAAAKAAAKALNISAQAIGYGAEAYEFGQSVDALLNAKTPEERRQAIMGLIAASAMSAPTPLIYGAKKLNKLRQQDPAPGSGANGGNTPKKPEGSGSRGGRELDPPDVVANDYPGVVGNRFPSHSGRTASSFGGDLPKPIKSGPHVGLVENKAGELFVAPDGPGGRYHQVLPTDDPNIYHLKSGPELQLRRQATGEPFQLERKPETLVRGGAPTRTRPRQPLDEASTLEGRERSPKQRIRELRARAEEQRKQYNKDIKDREARREAIDELVEEVNRRTREIQSGHPLPEGYQFPNPPTKFGKNLNERSQHNLVFGNTADNRTELILHGNQEGIYIEVRKEGNRFITGDPNSIEELAERVRLQPGYENVDHVVLYACCTSSFGRQGELPIAQQLAYELGKPVVAPVGEVDTVLSGGKLTATNAGPDAPEFRVFYP